MRIKITFILLLVCAFTTAEAESGIAAGDSKITYVGRIQHTADSVSFDWSGVTASIEFEGTCLSMDYTDSKCNWINVWIDRNPDEKSDAIIRLGGSEVTLAANLSKGKHRVVIQKRTEGEQGRLTIKSFATDGRFLKSDRRKERLIEFIGDSYTCGYGTESKSGKEHFRPETENCNLTYAAILGRTFNSDVRFISHSGRGVIRNYGGYDKDLPMCDKYPQTFDCGDPSLKWKPAKGEMIPQIVVIYLGTNDFSCGQQPTLQSWCDSYRKLLGHVKATYGNDIPVLCVASKADVLMSEYVRAAVEECGFDNVHYAAIFPKAHNHDSEVGADEHPNYKGHRKVALCMMPYISTLTGWDLPEAIH